MKSDSKISSSVKVPLRNGELLLKVTAVDDEGVNKPFITRILAQGYPKQTTRTEQHALISSVAELEKWVQADEFSKLHPDLFCKFQQLCTEVLE